MSPSHLITQILSRIDIDRRAAEELLPLVYDELRRLAASQLRRENGGQTLQATALVHEAYVRLIGHDDTTPQWDNRRHFFAAAAESMRRILVENARRKRRIKHGGDFTRGEFHDVPVFEAECREDLLALDEALAKLSLAHRPAAELVHLRYFAGLTMAEVAGTMEISERSAARLWTYARAWLLREMQGSDDREASPVTS